MSTNILEHLKWRYATKKFDDSKKLSEEKLNILKEAFNLTATSYGLQPLKLIVVGNDDLKKKLVPITMNQEQVANASHVLVLCVETKLDGNFIKDSFKRIENIRNTPRSILDPFESFLVDEFSKKPKSTIDTWMAKQAYIAMGNLLTVCALEGIDSCPIEGFEPEKYDQLLGLNKMGLQSVLVLPIGYRAKDDFFSTLKKVRRGVDEVVIELN
jgi:nitroreductase/dihydropteridine reductase